MSSRIDSNTNAPAGRCRLSPGPPAMNPSLCQRCRELFSLASLREVSGGSFAHGEAQIVIASARRGCPFCELICLLQVCALLGIPDEGGDIVECMPEDLVTLHVRSMGEGSLVDEIHIEVDGEKGQACCRVYAAEDDPASVLTTFRPVQTDVSSPAAAAAAREAIARCRDSHPACRPAADARPPSRLLDVTGGDEGFIYLRSTRDMAREEYVALSYCWGGDQPVKLLVRNKADLECGISFVSLPRSLQDAVTCTRALAYHYIWIDALCIIQDSVEDQREELGKMASIYRDAAVTIVAAGATSVSEGFLGCDRARSVASRLTPSGAKSEGPCRVAIRIDDGRIGTLTVIPKLEGIGHYWGEITLPTDRRAWCLQESLLPRRILLYTHEELLFRCQTVDCQPVLASPIDYSKGADPPRIFSSRLRSAGQDRIWQNLVSDFSKRQSSVAADRVVALEGVIHELEKEWGDECVFGLWKSQALRDLSWATGVKSRSLTRGTHAPSWSWMSVQGLICRVMTTSHPARSQDSATSAEAFRIGWEPDFDGDADEEQGSQVDYLYLGSASVRELDRQNVKYHRDVAIAAVKVDEGVYRRVGIVRQNIHSNAKGCTSDVWMECLRQKVTLI
ncbi:heterokaryon incompatibility protein-domain-containing protein [Durotheca rogersii]|uniref:heterokaryon incompatibility protein-domain-containing protein n=1 Tax=Durotheca rogersii TaxID=419775 RepID=UPI00221FC298|nr:heterokaryon incompatibility protein-domain-containing protein [Durotheca rogersii]KAI5860990.1 heterokaryon incompatibility protein-domain-containing protein [Durotheca rogersii]